MVIQHPDATTLLTFERDARRHGTNLTTADLQGCWMLQGVWNKGRLRPAWLSAWSLRGCRARLVLRELTTKQLAISNAVNVGPFQLRFEGLANLQGSRPLLQFSFNRVVLLVGRQRWIDRPLPAPAPAPSRLPFFALIHRDPTGWLAARGRGGGLAFWTLHAEGEETPPTDQFN
ncbi:MAG: hypothetical protein ACON4T_09945 [Synechococcus sp.]